MTDSQQTRTQTPEEQFRTLFDRTAKLSDAVSALLNPNWGANVGILPEDHPLYPKELEPLPSSIVKKPRLLDCGWCYEENGEEVHPHPECPIGAASEQAAPIDWQGIAERRERELKTVGEARHTAEATIERVRAQATAQRARGASGSTDHKTGLYDAAVAILAALDEPAKD